MADCDNFYCEVMSFGLKNEGATYQRLMDYIFKGMLGQNVEVYVNYIVVKSNSCLQHVKDLIFQALRDHDIWLNPDKCAFGVEGGMFLGFMLTHCGIETHPEKCRAITKMCSPENVKEIQILIGWLMTLSRFVPRFIEKTKSIVQLLRKAAKFKWTDECEEIYLQLKAFLASPQVIQKPNSIEPIIIYLTVSEDAVSATLVLHGVEVHYKIIEKVALALIVIA